VYEKPLRHIGELIAGSDIRYPLPNANDHALTGSFSPDLTLHTELGTTSVAELMQTARPILLDLAGRADFCDAVDEPADTAVPALTDAIVSWFGTPMQT
jgi:hypothetical protein